jgi:hypothetical protein
VRGEARRTDGRAIIALDAKCVILRTVLIRVVQTF